MPELPEVEVTRRGIIDALSGAQVERLIVRTEKLRWPLPAVELLAGRRINTVRRRAKYLLVDCGVGTLIIHLGMSGSLRLVPPDLPPEKHDHVDLVLVGGLALRYRDPRKFGSWLWFDGPIEQHPLLAALGPEPLNETFSADYLFERLRNRHSPIKPILMDQRLVVGVGNIYANEALFHAGIRPTRAASSLTLAECVRLVGEIKAVLLRALEAGGSTLRDFAAADGQPGYFQQTYYVYGRGGQPCRVCSMPIDHIRQAQRSSFYCASCQP